MTGRPIKYKGFIKEPYHSQTNKHKNNQKELWGRKPETGREKKKFNIRDFWLLISVPPDLSHQKRKLLRECPGAKTFLPHGPLRHSSYSLAEQVTAPAHPSNNCFWHLPPQPIPHQVGVPSQALRRNIFYSAKGILYPRHIKCTSDRCYKTTL